MASYGHRLVRVEENGKNLVGKGGISSVAISGRCFYIGCLNGNLLRWFYDQREVNRIVFEGKKDAETLEIRRVFVEPKGYHTIISMADGSCWYLSSASDEAQQIERLQGHTVESVAWNRQCSETATKSIILGTRQGKLLEVSIDNGKEKLNKLLYELPAPIVAVYFDVLSSRGSATTSWVGEGGSEQGCLRNCVLCAAGGCLYEFVGGPNLESLFQAYMTANKASPTKAELRYEVGVDTSYSELHLAPPVTGGPGLVLFWLTGAGLITSPVELSSTTPSAASSSSASVPSHRICCRYPPNVIAFPAPADNCLLPIPGVALKSIAVTNYHIVCLFEDRLSILSRVTQHQVYEQAFPRTKYGQLKQLMRDPYDGSVWLYTDQYIYEVVISNESEGMWKLFLKEGAYKTALAHCQTVEQREAVVVAQASSLFDRGLFKQAARCYVNAISIPFEEICLKFLQTGQESALLEFLKLTLSKLGSPGVDTSSCTPQAVMLLTWILELSLQRLNRMEAQIQGAKRLAHADDETKTRRAQQKLERLQKELESFLEQIKRLDELQATVYSLLHGGGRSRELLYFADARCDYETLILHQVTHKQYKSAIEKLANSSSIGGSNLRDSLLLRFSPTLYLHEPEAFVQFVLASSPETIYQLLPSLFVQSSAAHREQAIRLLEVYVKKEDYARKSAYQGCWKGRGALWMALVVLYADSGKEDELLSLLSTAPAGLMEYDGHFALRYCEEKKLHRASVLLYGLMGLYEEGVEKALASGDYVLAKENASRSNDEHLKKRLWVVIAQYMAEHDDVGSLIGLVKDSQGLLKLQDILPCLADSTLLDVFKDEICDALDGYQHRINLRKQEMEEHREASESLKEDIRAVNERCVVTSLKKVCESCREPLFTEKFYAFPCGHCFHASCAQSLKCHTLSVEDCQNYNLLAKALDEAVQRQGSEVAVIESQLDAIIADECLICGSTLVKSITEPFIGPNEPPEEVQCWSITG